MFDLVTVGHFAIDLITSPRIAYPEPTLGGPPTYVSLAARKLGAKVSVISKVGEDFPHEYVAWLEANGVDLSGLKRIKGAKTTGFTLKYVEKKRRLQLRSLAPLITPEDIPRFLNAKAVHIAPIANEVLPETIHELRRLTDTLSLDPQGFVRKFNKDGNVSPKKWANPQVLGKIDLYKSSTNEIKMVTGLTELRSAIEKIQDYGAKIVMVTKGLRGSILLYAGDFYDIPACKPRTVQDPTGAGDAFMGAFLAEYVKGKEPHWCACVGSAAASFVTEGIGPTIFGEKKEVYARAAKIYGPPRKSKAFLF